MTKFLISALAVLMSSAVCAETDASHYKAEAIQNPKHAVTILKQAKDTIFKTLSMPEMSSSDYEELHQLSYNMEAAMEEIEDAEIYPDTVINPLEDVIEDIHEASEDYQKQDLEHATEAYSTLVDAL